MLKAAGLDVSAPVSISAEIPAAKAVMLIQRTMRLTGDEMCGLASRPIRLGAFSQCCKVAAQASTVEQALRAACRYYRGLADDFQLRVMNEGAQTRIALIDMAPSRPGRETMHLVVLHTLLAVIQWLSGRIGFVERVELQYPLVPRIEIQEAVFRARFVGDAPLTSLVVDSATLSRSIVDQAVSAEDFADSMIHRLALIFEDTRTVAERAIQHIRAHQEWDIGLQKIATAFHMSADTFNRRLHEDVGVGFQELKDRMRCAAAMELLEHEDVNLDQVAHRLGFSELSTFHRAFKRWTGQRPGAYRDRLQTHATDDPSLECSVQASGAQVCLTE